MKQPIYYNTIPSFLWIVLILIGSYSLLVRFDIEFNGGQIDEYDYLFVSKMLFSGQTWETYSYIFGSNLNWYILGIGETIGGLTGARVLSFFMGILSLIGLYKFTLRLWNSHEIALFSTLFFSIQASHLFISRFATYDVIALMFLSFLLPTFWDALHKQRVKTTAFALSIAFAMLAVTGKYVDIVYVPILTFFAFFISWRIGILLGVIVGSFLGIYVVLHLNDLRTLYTIQILGTHATNSTYAEILQMEWRYLWIGIVAWWIAIVWQFYYYGIKTTKEKTTFILIALLLLALPLAFYHLQGRNMISLFKHMVYGLYFLSPVVGWLLWKLLNHFYLHRLAQAGIAIVLIGVAFYNYALLKAMENGFPDTRLAIKAVQALPLDESTTIASEDPYLMRYLLFGKLPQSHIKELYWMDNNLDGVYTYQDTVSALWDQKFTYVFLNNLINPKANEKLRNILNQRGYKKIFETKWHTSNLFSRITNGALELYERTSPPIIPTKNDRMFCDDSDIYSNPIVDSTK